MPDLPLVERRPASAASRNADADKFLADITALLPDIRARAEQTERLGVVADDIVQALTDAGVFRAVQPRQWGGLELDHSTFYEGMVLIASACGATGWVASRLVDRPRSKSGSRSKSAVNRVAAKTTTSAPTPAPLATTAFRRRSG